MGLETIDPHSQKEQTEIHPASRAFFYGSCALYREKALHESCQVLVEHAQRVVKIQFRTQAIHISRDTTSP